MIGHGPTPTLLSERLVLRPLVLNDALHFERLLGGDEAAVMMLSHMPWPLTIASACGWIGMRLAGGARIFAVTLPSLGSGESGEPRRGSGSAETVEGAGAAPGAATRNEEFLGCLGFGGRLERLGFGYWIGRPYWGRGYATEALLTVLDWAETLGARQAEADTFPQNPASARVLAKAGFKDCGLLERDFPLRGGLRLVRLHRKELRPQPSGH